jgi:hypothetical protein
MTVDTLKQWYQEGRITATTLSQEVILHLDGPNTDSILGALPMEILDLMIRYVDSYVPGKMLTFGSAKLPTQEQIEYAREWIRLHLNR